jgi:glycosyltransferase involved in cell wall biosynthesis
MLPCEWGIGYEGTYTQFRVFESYTWMHHVHGVQKDSNGRFFDSVIPNSFEKEDFPIGKGDGGYYLFLGRVILRKGPHIAAEVCKHLGEKLVVAGQGVWKEEPGKLYGLDNVVVECPDLEYAGVAGTKERADLLMGAKAVFMPTLYLEPFGGVACEAMLCGTPVITTDWGAFTETIKDGSSGYRCHMFKEFVEAAQKAPDLNRASIRKHALRYTTDRIRHEYDNYFRRLGTLRDTSPTGGWYSMEY